MQLSQSPLALVLSASLALPSVALARVAPAPVAPVAAGEMTPEQQMETAKGLYGEGVAALDAGDAATALTKFESAYNEYAPSLHVFNYNIGQAAFALNDCVKAKTAFQRFLDLVPEHTLRGDATERILEIERSGCANVAAAAAPVAAATTPVPVNYDDESDDAPDLTSRKNAREDKIEEEEEEEDAKKVPKLLLVGSILAGVGGLSLIGGAVSLGLANKKANDLAGLASPGPTGFPDGNYSDDDVFNLDRNQLPANNKATIGLFAGGGVLATVGVALIIVHVKKKKGGKRKPGDGDKDARTGGPRLVGLGAAPTRGGGGASATLRF